MDQWQLLRRLYIYRSYRGKAGWLDCQPSRLWPQMRWKPQVHSLQLGGRRHMHSENRACSQIRSYKDNRADKHLRHQTDQMGERQLGSSMLLSNKVLSTGIAHWAKWMWTNMRSQKWLHSFQLYSWEQNLQVDDRINQKRPSVHHSEPTDGLWRNIFWLRRLADRQLGRSLRVQRQNLRWSFNCS